MAKAVKNRNDIQHVIPIGTGWAVKEQTANDFFIITMTKSEAVKVARQLAQKGGTELVIHNKDGRIRERVSYAPAGGTATRKK